jgi:hypothetical protein
MVQYRYLEPEIPRDDAIANLEDYWILYAGTYLQSPAGNPEPDYVDNLTLFSAFNIHVLEPYQSGKTMIFRNVMTGATKTLTLPTLPNDVFFTVVRGIPIIYTPHVLNSTGSSYNADVLTPPFLTGKFTVHASDWTNWGKVLELDPPTELTGVSDEDMIIYSRSNGDLFVNYESVNPFMAVGAFGDDLIGVYTTWGPIYESGASEGPQTSDYTLPTTRRARAHVRLYNKSFQYVESKILTVGV